MPPWQHGKIGSGWRAHGTRGKQIIATEHAQCNQGCIYSFGEKGLQLVQPSKFFSVTIFRTHSIGSIKGLSTREAGRGHATPHMPVETAKCWWLLKIEPSLSLKPAQPPSKMGPKPLAKLYNSPKNLQLAN